MNKQMIRNSGNISTGEHHRVVVDLAKGERLSKSIYIPALGFTSASVRLTSTSKAPDATNTEETTGTIDIEQSVVESGGGAMSPPAQLVVSSGATQEVYDISFSGQYIVLKSNITYKQDVPEQGKITIDIVLKR